MLGHCAGPHPTNRPAVVALRDTTDDRGFVATNGHRLSNRGGAIVLYADEQALGQAQLPICGILSPRSDDRRAGDGRRRT